MVDDDDSGWDGRMWRWDPIRVVMTVENGRVQWTVRVRSTLVVVEEEEEEEEERMIIMIAEEEGKTTTMTIMSVVVVATKRKVGASCRWRLDQRSLRTPSRNPCWSARLDCRAGPCCC